MAKPRVFISSTFVDLRNLRETLEKYFKEIEFEPILFERGGIYFDHTQPLDQSCYEAIKDCNIFVLILGGRYGSRASDLVNNNRTREYNSITKNEYATAQGLGIPVFIFVDSQVLSEFSTFMKNKNNSNIKYAYVDDPQIFALIDDIYGLKKNNPVFPYSNVDDIIIRLKTQFAGMIKNLIENKKESSSSIVSYINAYKLFYYRRQKGLSSKELSNMTGIKLTTLRRLERVNRKKADSLTLSLFSNCDHKSLTELERVLGCPGELSCGKDDDFMSLFIQYYYTYRGQNRSKPLPQEITQELSLFPVKAVVFDFDGTLTNRHEDKTTWERIWSSLGYDLNDCAFYHNQFSKGVISHEEWCKITCQKFRDRNLSEQQLLEISESISLIPGTAVTLRMLREKNIRLFILSGSIKAIIKNALGELYDLFDEIKANDLIFGDDAKLKEIIGTKYDFKGKADFLRQVIKDYRFSPLEVLFIGNSCNDIWASESGARTLCVNPHFTDHTNVKHWSYAIRKMADLNEIMKYL